MAKVVSITPETAQMALDAMNKAPTPPDRTADFGSEVKLSRGQLIHLWDIGIINDKSYIALALMLDGIDSDTKFNPEYFIERWKGLTEKGGDLKRLEVSTVLKTLGDFDKKDFVNFQGSIQLSICFGDEAW